MPWTYTFHRQAMLNRTTRILKPIAFRTRFHGETIKMLWLKRSCYDLKRSQRFHAKTSPLQWLKTKCYDLTLPLVGVSQVQDSEVHSKYLFQEFQGSRIPQLQGAVGWHSSRSPSKGTREVKKWIPISISYRYFQCQSPWELVSGMAPSLSFHRALMDELEFFVSPCNHCSGIRPVCL